MILLFMAIWTDAFEESFGKQYGIPDILHLIVLTCNRPSQNLTTTQGKEVAQFRGGDY